MKTLQAVALLVLFSAAMASGQLHCTEAAGTNQPLVCLVPFASSNYVSLPTNQGGAVIQAAAQQAAVPINGSIATQLTQLPVPSGTSGTIILQEKGKLLGGAFDDLGPVLTQRPETVGAKKLYAGVAYQRFRFNALDGTPTGSLQFGFQAQTSKNTVYYDSNSASINFKLDQYVALITYGATKTTDVSVTIPFNSVSVKANSSNFQSYQYANGVYTDQNKDLTPIKNFNAGAASGLGDIKFGVKQLLYGGDGKSLAVAAGFGLRIPSGDAQNFLGSGAYGAEIYGLLAYRSSTAFLSPHVKIGKQWNGPTVLLNPTGAGDIRLPGGMQYEAGTDIKAVPRKVTLSIDVIGNQFTNAPTLSPGILVNPSTAGSQLAPLNAELPENKTYTKINFSSGIKYAPLGTSKLIFYGNVLIQLNNVGLRSDPVPLVGASYNFNFGKAN